MIKINLLPAKKSRKQEKGQRMILLGIVALVAAVVGMVFLQLKKSDEVAAQVTTNNGLQQQVKNLSDETIEYDAKLAEFNALDQKQTAIKALRDASQTPTWALDELAQILQKNRRPNSGPRMNEHMQDRIRGDKPDKNLVFSDGWDPKHLWLTSIDEHDHNIEIKGAAAADKDVTQFTLRLQASVYFTDVMPIAGAQEVHPQLHIPYYTFTVRAKVLY